MTHPAVSSAVSESVGDTSSAPNSTTTRAGGGHAGPRGWRFLRGVLRGLLGILGLGALAVTIALTIPRFVDPQSYRVAQLATAAPLGLVTGAISAVLFLGVALSRGRGRLLSTLATIVAVGMTALHAWWLAPLFTGTVPAAEPGKTLTLLSQNFEYGNATALAAEVARQNVDILVVVDLTPGQFDAIMASGIPRQFPYSGGADKDAPSHTLVFSKYTLKLRKLITSGGSSRLYDVTSPQLGHFELAAVHPAPPYIDGTATWHSEYRLISSAVRDHVESRSTAPLIAAGDFNASLDLRPFRDLLRDGALRGAVEERNSGWQPTFRAGGMPLMGNFVFPPLAQIDHVLVSQQLVVTSVKTFDAAGSDHLAVLVRLAPAAADRTDR